MEMELLDNERIIQVSGVSGAVVLQLLATFGRNFNLTFERSSNK